MVVPTAPIQIDADWLNLVVGGGESVYRSVSLTTLGADVGMYGRLARVEGIPTNPSSPISTFVAKFAVASDDARAALGSAGLYRNEYEFYTRMSADFPIRVPRCHFAHYDPTTFDTLLLLDWLEGEFGDDVKGGTLTQAQIAVDTAAVMHRYWAEPGRLDQHTWLPRLAGSSFYHAFAAIDADVAKRALAIIGDRAPAWLRRNAAGTARIVQAQIDALDRLPMTLTHVDCRFANMSFDATGNSMALCDWQTPYRFAGIWDVACMLIHGLSVANRRAWQDELLARYCGTRHVPDWAVTAFRRAALLLAFNTIRNAPVFDLSNTGAANLLWAFVERSCAAVEDTGALDLIEIGA